jgi:uncharacterized membrane protein YfcA
MFENKSKTGTGLAGVAVFIIVYLLRYFGFDVAEADIVTLVSNLVGAAGIILAYYGQYTRKDQAGLINRA